MKFIRVLLNIINFPLSVNSFELVTLNMRCWEHGDHDAGEIQLMHAYWENSKRKYAYSLFPAFLVACEQSIVGKACYLSS